MWCTIGQTTNEDVYIFTEVKANSLGELAGKNPKQLVVIKNNLAQIIYNPKNEKIFIEEQNNLKTISLCGYIFNTDGLIIKSHNMPEDFLSNIKILLLVPAQK